MQIKTVLDVMMEIRCEGPTEIADALECWKGLRPNSAEFFKEFQKPGPIRVKAKEKHLACGGGFEKVTVDVTTYFLPYLELLKKRTGADLSPMRVKALEGIFNTHICEKAEWNGKILLATVAVMVYPTMNFSPDRPLPVERRLEQAINKAFRYIREDLGRVEVQKEFIPVRGGLYKRNPDYATGKPRHVIPQAINTKVWDGVWGHWLENQASDGQKEIAGRISVASPNSSKAPPLENYGPRPLYLDNFAESMEWEEFAAL